MGATLREASGWSGPSKLQWKAARSSSGRMWFPDSESEKGMVMERQTRFKASPLHVSDFSAIPIDETHAMKKPIHWKEPARGLLNTLT